LEATQKKIIYIFVVLVIGYLLIDKFVLQKIPKRYNGFGINLPSGFSVHGIDVSRYQRDIDWKMVHAMRDKGARIEFAIIKATEGITICDPYYKKNNSACEKIGIIKGAYHYFRANQSGTEQANYFIKNTELASGDLAPIIDIEEANGVKKDVLKKRLKECLDILEEKYDTKPIIYSGVDFYDAYLEQDFDDYPYWPAHYYQSKPRVSRDWMMWQHSDKGNVDGIDGPVDFNTVNGSIMNLRKYCIR
jgi:lysozyme